MLAVTSGQPSQPFSSVASGLEGAGSGLLRPTSPDSADSTHSATLTSRFSLATSSGPVLSPVQMPLTSIAGAVNTAFGAASAPFSSATARPDVEAGQPQTSGQTLSTIYDASTKVCFAFSLHCLLGFF